MTNDLKQNNMQNTPQEQEQMKLDDARRVKVLSPGMLVFKRFIRNKLAVVGIIILVIMFLYSFLGPLFSPYKRAQIFVKEVEEWGDYATGKFNNESRFLGKTSSSINTAVLKALGSMKKAGKYALTAGQEIPFTAGNDHYTLKVINPDGQRPSCALFGTDVSASSSACLSLTTALTSLDADNFRNVLAKCVFSDGHVLTSFSICMSKSPGLRISLLRRISHLRLSRAFSAESTSALASPASGPPLDAADDRRAITGSTLRPSFSFEASSLKCTAVTSPHSESAGGIFASASDMAFSKPSIFACE